MLEGDREGVEEDGNPDGGWRQESKGEARYWEKGRKMVGEQERRLRGSNGKVKRCLSRW